MARSGSKNLTGKKMPVLRKGVTVDDLMAGTSLVHPDAKNEIHSRALRAALQVFIDEHLRKGERASRGDVIKFARNLGYGAKEIAESIRKRINSGELTATVLDELVS